MSSSSGPPPGTGRPPTIVTTVPVCKLGEAQPRPDSPRRQPVLTPVLEHDRDFGRRSVRRDDNFGERQLELLEDPSIGDLFVDDEISISSFGGQRTPASLDRFGGILRESSAQERAINITGFDSIREEHEFGRNSF